MLDNHVENNLFNGKNVLQKGYYCKGQCNKNNTHIFEEKECKQ